MGCVTSKENEDGNFNEINNIQFDATINSSSKNTTNNNQFTLNLFHNIISHRLRKKNSSSSYNQERDCCNRYSSFNTNATIVTPTADANPVSAAFHRRRRHHHHQHRRRQNSTSPQHSSNSSSGCGSGGSSSSSGSSSRWSAGSSNNNYSPTQSEIINRNDINNHILQTALFAVTPEIAMHRNQLPNNSITTSYSFGAHPFYMGNSDNNNSLQIAQFVPIAKPISTNKSQMTRSDSISDDCSFPDCCGGGGSACSIGGVGSSLNYRHHLIHHLDEIYSMPHYWGVMDRYEAEAILADKPPGSYLLRDSAHKDFIFTVSFNRFQLTLHARVQLSKSHYTFYTAHNSNNNNNNNDNSITSTTTIQQQHSRNLWELLKCYQDSSSLSFFQPLCFIPVNRNFPFSLQNLCRARITSCCAYEKLIDLPLPELLINYLRHYHYKVPVQINATSTNNKNNNNNNKRTV